MLSETDAKLVAALVAAVASLIGVVISAIVSQRMARSTQQQVESLRAELAQRSKDRDAARDYEYAARKRLYAECEPILFRFSEACDAARRRISRLGAPKSTGLDLRRDGSDRVATFYRLMAPLVEFTILRERLTAFDLGLDQRVYVRYLLGRLLIEAISDDVALAAEEPARSYIPGGRPGLLSPADPLVYLRQGIPPEDLEQLIEAMMVGAMGNSRVISFASFKQAMTTKGALKDVCLRLVPMVHDFEPATRPILWRALSTQHALLTLMASMEPGAPTSSLAWSDALRAPSTGNQQLDEETMRACRSYLSPRLERLIEAARDCAQGVEA